MNFWTFFLPYLLAMNGLAYWAFHRDKRAALSGARRIPEDRLLALIYLGGGLGGKLAQHLLRHKIRSEPFRTQLNGILAVQITALAAVWAIWLMSRA